jgi:hypothetical protein
MVKKLQKSTNKLELIQIQTHSLISVIIIFFYQTYQIIKVCKFNPFRLLLRIFLDSLVKTKNKKKGCQKRIKDKKSS